MNSFTKGDSGNALFTQIIYETCRSIECAVSEGMTLSIAAIRDLMNRHYSALSRTDAGENSSISPYFDANGWEKLSDDLEENFFLSKSVCSVLLKVIDRAVQARTSFKAETEADGPFPSEKTIRDYLKVYYELIKRLRIHNNQLQIDESRYKDFISSILNIDIKFGETGIGEAFYNPAALDGLLQSYYALYDYVDAVKKATSEAARANYRQILISRELRRFRWKVVYNDVLYHVAIPPFEAKGCCR